MFPIRPLLRARGMRTLLLCGVLSLAAVLPARADSPYLYGIHWWGYTPGQPIDSTPAILLDAPTHGGWTVETVLTHSSSWWGPAYFVPLYQDLYTQKNISIITRVDFNWGDTVPYQNTMSATAWANSVVSAVNTLRNYSHIWVIGNEPNIIGEGNGWPNGQVTPSGYAAIYRAVRNAIHSSALPSPAGPHIVLIAAPSPGGVIPGVRWMAGDTWLSQVVDQIPANEIDGFALHAYGGTVTEFRNSYSATLTMLDAKGMQSKPAYMTEWNRYSTPGNASQEAAAAQFLRDAFADVHAWNQTPGKHNIVCMAWFVYDANQQASGAWNGYSIEYWKDNGNPAGHPGDLFTAFRDAVSQRYPAGDSGVATLIADFVGSPTTGRIPLTVNFTDQTQGNVLEWIWNFGDGSTSTQQNPSHTYQTPGTYTVTLTAKRNDKTSTKTRTNYIVVKPIAGDHDADGDVDQQDFGFFQACFSGQGVPAAPDCAWARLDGDEDVDQHDFTIFRGCMSGENVPASPDCD